MSEVLERQQPCPNVTKEFLARAHSPDSADRIFNDKILHRCLKLSRSSPTPTAINARLARRKARAAARARSRSKPKPLSGRERRKLGLEEVPRNEQKYSIYEPLNKLWLEYVREVLGDDIYTGGPQTAAKLASIELHGALVEVVRSRCPSRVGIKGLVVRDRKFVLEIVMPNNALKIVPKEGTMFRVEVATENPSRQGITQSPFAFDILGDQMMLRSTDRANRKFKTHFLERL